MGQISDVLGRGGAARGDKGYDGRGPRLGAGALGAAEGRSGDCETEGDGAGASSGHHRRCRCDPLVEAILPAQQPRPGDRFAHRRRHHRRPHQGGEFSRSAGSMNAIPAVEIAGLGKRYGRVVALDDVTFAVRQEGLFALLGPNGAGKTTLLHILSTILRPHHGTARVAGFHAIAQPASARRSVGVVFQEPSLDDRLTVFENLNFHGLVYGVPGALRRRRIEEMLDLVELTDWREKLVRTLSSGMKRRLE